MTEKKAKLSRRNFLLTVGAGGAATAAAIVTTKNTLHREKRRRQACDARLSRDRAHQQLLPHHQGLGEPQCF